MLKVAHVINSMSGSGGAEHGLVRELLQLEGRFSQEVVTLYEGGQLADEVENAGIELTSIGLEPSSSGWNWTVGALRLRRHLARSEPDVVHSSLASGNLVAQLATLGRAPVLSTFTLSGDVDLMRAYQPGAASWKASIFRGLSTMASRSGHVWYRAITRDAAVTNARALGVNENRVVVIPRGVPIGGSSPGPDVDELRNELGLPTDRPVLLNVGRQTAQKGHTYLVEAMRRIRSQGPAHLVILGREGDGTHALSDAIRRHELGDDVTIIPYSSRVHDYYCASDVFVFSSMMEGLGTAVLEAMAAGLPVVAFDIPPVAEVTDAGRVSILVEPGDTRAMADTVLDLLDRSEDRNAYSDAAQVWVRQRFSIETVADRLGDVLERLAAGHGLSGTPTG